MFSSLFGSKPEPVDPILEQCNKDLQYSLNHSALNSVHHGLVELGYDDLEVIENIIRDVVNTKSGSYTLGAGKDRIYLKI